MTTECYNLVRDFHLKFGQPIYDARVTITSANRHLRVRLLLEELGEVAVAWHEKNMVAFADGLADLLYVTAGAAVGCLKGAVVDPWKQPAPRAVPPTKLAMDVAILCNVIHTDHNHDRLRLQLERVMTTIYEIATRHRIPLRECFLEVHKSNMTKEVRELKDGQKGGFKGSAYEPPNLAPLLGLSQQP